LFNLFIIDWLESVGSQILFELDPKKPVLYVVPIESILGKLPVVPAGELGTVRHGKRAQFPGAVADSTQGAAAPETAVTCGMSIHGLWSGSVMHK
jgi:hypothetical protein